MDFPRGGNVIGFPFGLVKKADGNGFADTDGTPLVFITIDGGTQITANTVPSYEGNFQWTTNFLGQEMEGSLIGVMITHALVIPEHFTIKTTVPDSFTPTFSVQISSAGTSIVDEFEYYGTLNAADLYFANRIDSDNWEQTSINDRQTAS